MEFVLKFAIPDVITDPSLDSLQTTVKQLASKIVETSKSIYWIHPKQDKLFYDCLNLDVSIKNILGIFDSLLSGNFLLKKFRFEFLLTFNLQNIFYLKIQN